MPTTGVGTVDLVLGGGLLAGWALEETTGAAQARVVIGDGNNAGVSPQPIAPVRLSANESNREYPPMGVIFQRSITMQVTLGSVQGVVWVVIIDPDQLFARTDLETY